MRCWGALKSRCEMLIGGDDISNDVITLSTCFLMFVYIGAGFRFALTVNGGPQGNWRWNSNSRDVVASSSSFSRPAARSPKKVCSQARHLPGKFWCLGQVVAYQRWSHVEFQLYYIHYKDHKCQKKKKQ